MAKSARVDNARVQELKAAQAASERKRRLTIAGAATGVVVLVIAVVVFAALNAPKGAVTTAKTSGAISDTLAKDLSGVTTATYDTVGLGTAQAGVLTPATGELALKDGKPRVVYVGAEFCPYCASERWALVTALSRFGTFTGIEYAVSSPTDTPSNIPTLSLKNAKYTSDVLSFEAYEVQDREGNPLQTEPDDVKKLQQDTGQTGIPFIYYAGKGYQAGTSVDGSTFGTDPQDVIGEALRTPTSEIAKSVLGGANLTTAKLCQLTGDKPADVCTSPGVTAAAAALKTS